MENTPNRFEELDKLEENKKNQYVENKPKPKSKNMKPLLGILFAVIGVVFGYLLTSGKLFPPKDKVFESHGITVTLNDEFHEKEYLGFQVAYLSDKSFFAANREEKKLFSGTGIYNLKTYTNAVLELNNKKSEIKEGVTSEGQKSYSAKYTSEVDGDSFSYYLVTLEGDSHYYTINFGCKSKNFAKFEDQYIEWAKTIIVE